MGPIGEYGTYRGLWDLRGAVELIGDCGTYGGYMGPMGALWDLWRPWDLWGAMGLIGDCGTYGGLWDL